MIKLRLLFTLFLIAQITFPSEVVHAFSFIPDFIQHFDHHNESHHRIGFVDFVLEHTTGEHHEDEQHHEHDRCPINHNHATTTINIAIVEQEKFDFAPYSEENLAKRTIIQSTQDAIISGYASSIWQPPRV